MTCDPNTLSNLSSRLRALSDAQLMITRTYLMCQWLNVANPPIPTGTHITTQAADRITTESALELVTE